MHDNQVVGILSRRDLIWYVLKLRGQLPELEIIKSCAKCHHSSLITSTVKYKLITLEESLISIYRATTRGYNEG